MWRLTIRTDSRWKRKKYDSANGHGLYVLHDGKKFYTLVKAMRQSGSPSMQTPKANPNHGRI